MRLRSSVLVVSAVWLVGLGWSGALACSSFSAADSAEPAPPSEGGTATEASAGDASAALDALPVEADAGSAYRTAVLADGPIGYWRMGGVGVASDVRDEMGAHPLFLQGQGHQLDVPGAIPGDLGDNKAIRFDGIGSFATVVDAGAFDFPDRAPFTLECWGRREVLDGGGEYFENLLGKIDGYHPNARGYLLYVAPNATSPETSGQMAEPDASAGIYGPVVGPDVWAHYALVFDGKSLTLYVNGTAVATRNVTQRLAPRPGDFIVGRDPRQLRGYWPGAIDEIAIYPRALSIVQILAHYNIGQK
jgi:hypothetical protein